jgi:hypothetical protein
MEVTKASYPIGVTSFHLAFLFFLFHGFRVRGMMPAIVKASVSSLTRIYFRIF